MTESERPDLPTPLRAVAYFTILCGIATALTMVVALTKGHLNLNIGVLQIPAGFGLLRLSRGWRTFQLWMLWFGMIGFGLGFLIFLLGSWNPSITGFGSFVQSRSRELAVIICGLMFGLEFWQYRILTGRQARLLFGLTIPSRARRNSTLRRDGPAGLRAGRGTDAGPDESSSAPPRDP